jgi:hypothetical protein
MIYGEVASTKRIRHVKILADANRRRILDFPMSWHSGGSLGGGIIVDAVLGPFAEESTAVCLQMAD